MNYVKQLWPTALAMFATGCSLVLFGEVFILTVWSFIAIVSLVLCVGHVFALIKLSGVLGEESERIQDAEEVSRSTRF